MTSIALPVPTAARRAGSYRYLIAFAVTLASVLELVDTSIVNVAIPHMMGNLGATLEEIAWVSTGYIVANVIVLPLTSWFADRFGRRNYYTGSIVLFTIASVLCGSARSLEGLVAWRIVQGLGGGALISTAQAILFDVFPGKDRALGAAIFGVGVMVGPTLGPTLGGWITDNYSWPWIFYINLPLGILAAALSWRFVPEPAHRNERSRSVDWLGVALLVLGIGALQIMLERGEAKGWFEAREVQIEAALAALGLIWFVWHELTTDHPIVDLRVLKDRQLAVAVIFGFALGTALYASVFALPVFLQTELGYGAWETGKVLLPGAIASAVTMGVMGRINAKIDVRLPILAGVCLYFVSMWMHAHFTAEIGYGDVLWPLVIRGIGLGLIFPPLTSSAVATLHPRNYGQGTGLYSLFRQLGGSIGIAIVASLITRFTEHAREGLRTHLDLGNPVVVERLAGLTRGFLRTTGDPALARQQAIAALNAITAKQASVVAFEKVFLAMGVAFLCAVPLLLFFRTGRIQGARGAAAAH